MNWVLEDFIDQKSLFILDYIFLDFCVKWGKKKKDPSVLFELLPVWVSVICSWT